MMEEESFDDKNHRHHGRFICSVDGGNILMLYIRVFRIGKTRAFQSINLFQCDRCSSFYAMENGTKNLIPLVVKSKAEWLSLLPKNKRGGGE